MFLATMNDLLTPQGLAAVSGVLAAISGVIWAIRQSGAAPTSAGNVPPVPVVPEPPKK